MAKYFVTLSHKGINFIPNLFLENSHITIIVETEVTQCVTVRVLPRPQSFITRLTFGILVRAFPWALACYCGRCNFGEKLGAATSHPFALLHKLNCNICLCVAQSIVNTYTNIAYPQLKPGKGFLKFNKLDIKYYGCST